MKRTRILFVCMGNICRSPTAEGVMRKMIQERGLHQWIDIDSAGTHSYHINKTPDPRARQAAIARGIDISGLRARQIQATDFREFDYILASDEQNYADLAQICPRSYAHKLRYIMDFAPQYPSKNVPDPYYGGPLGFELVLDMIEDACQGLITSLTHEKK